MDKVTSTLKEMSSNEIGDLLENKIFQILKELLENDKLYFNKKFSKIYQKQGYYSAKRKKDIVFDISIESFLPDADQYSQLTIFECKNLGKNVSIDDIEEFSSKLSQVGEHNTKGVMVTKKGFSKTVINFARSEKIGLLVLKDTDEVDWVNYRKSRTRQVRLDDFNEPFIAAFNKQTFTNFADLLLELQVIDSYVHHPRFISVPYRSHERIQNIINRMSQYDIYNDGCLDTEKLCDFISSKYDISFNFIDLEEGILGKLDFEPLKISIDKGLDKNRFRFTLCHEIGHLVLHSKLLSQSLNSKSDDISSFILKAHSSKALNKRLEYQANLFANLLLLPAQPLKEEVKSFLEKENLKHGYLFFDEQPVNRILVNKLLSELSRRFLASKTAIRYRLITLNLLKDRTDFLFRNVYQIQ